MRQMRRTGPIAAVMAASFLAGCTRQAVPADEVAEAEQAVEEADDLRAVYVVFDGESAADIFLRLKGTVKAREASQRRYAELQEQYRKLQPQWTARGVTVMANLGRLVNAVQVLAPSSALSDLRRLPGVVRIDPVTRFELTNSSAVVQIGAVEAWSGSVPATGAGMRIGILDSGIDYTHAAFGGPGNPSDFTSNDSAVIEPGTFPTLKVFGGKDFVGDAYNPSGGVRTPTPDDDPLDCGGHGTHVAGTAGGQGVATNGQPYTGTYDQTFSGEAFQVGPGMAPEATLFALKVFGCGGGTEMIAPAMELAADPNEDADFSDRLDVVNASLGLGYGVGSSTEAQLTETLIDLGTVFVAAAGNDGDPGRAYHTLAAPASYTKALSVAATLNTQFTFMGFEVSGDATATGIYAASEARFSLQLSNLGNVEADLVLAEPADACGGITNRDEVDGNIVLIDRGDCPFFEKFTNAADASAAGVVVINNDVGNPFSMGGTDASIPVPGVMIRQKDGDLIKEHLAKGLKGRMAADLFMPAPIGPDYVASFSSRGPSADLGLLKPEVAAPGLRVFSARVGTGNGRQQQSGTSMASPVTAGAAALVRQAHPNFTALDVKAALMNHTAPVVDLDKVDFPMTLSGAGRIDAARAVAATVTARAVEPEGAIGVAFGTLTASDSTAFTREVTVRNHGSQAQTLDISASLLAAVPGVVVSASPEQLTVQAGAEATVTVTMEIEPEQLPVTAPDNASAARLGGLARQMLTEASGHVRVKPSSGSELTLPFQAFVRPGSDRSVAPAEGCAPGAGLTTFRFTGQSAHQKPAVSVLTLLEENPTPGVQAIGYSSNVGRAADDADTMAFIGVVLDEEWQTPARAYRTPFAINVDAAGRFALWPDPYHPFRPDPPVQGFQVFGDVISGGLLDLSRGGVAVGTPTPVNMVQSSDAETYPYATNVLVLPLRLEDVGADLDDPNVKFSVTLNFPQMFSPTSKSYIFDKTAQGLEVEFENDRTAPVITDGDFRVRIGPGKEGQDRRLLVLHHSAASQAGRHEIVELPDTDGLENGNLKIEAAKTGTVDAGDDATSEFTVTNESDVARSNVTVTGLVTGGTVLSAEPSTGSCTLEPALECDLGTLDPNAVVTLSVIMATESDQAATPSPAVSVTVASQYNCDDDAADDSAEAVFELIPDTPPTKPPGELSPSGGVALTPVGGCGCRAAGGNGTSHSGWMWAALAAAVLGRARKPRR